MEKASSKKQRSKRRDRLLASGDGVAAVDAEVGARDVAGRVREQEGHGAHQVLGLAHGALRDERGPLALQVRVVLEDLFRAVGAVSIHTCLKLFSFWISSR